MPKTGLLRFLFWVLAYKNSPYKNCNPVINKNGGGIRKKKKKKKTRNFGQGISVLLLWKVGRKAQGACLCFLSFFWLFPFIASIDGDFVHWQIKTKTQSLQSFSQPMKHFSVRSLFTNYAVSAYNCTSKVEHKQILAD